MNKIEDQERWIEIGQVGRPHGVNGEVKVRLFNQQSDFFEIGKRIKLELANGQSKKLRIDSIKGGGKKLIVRFSQIEELQLAKTLVSAMVLAAASDLPRLAAGEYYHYQLIGLDVFDQQRQLLGKVKKVQSGVAQDLLLVLADNGQEAYVPLIEQFVLDVNLAEGAISIKNDQELWQ